MKTILYPARENWEELCERPGIKKAYLESAIRDILYRVSKEKDEALRYYCEKFDGYVPGSFKVTEKELTEAEKKIPVELRDAIKTAADNIRKFHSSQLAEEPVIETMKGVRCWRKSKPVEKVGLYIPGGSAPLFSTLLMLGIPAKIAGCKTISVCTPAGRDGNVNPIILYTANYIGLKDVYRIGGPQAIGAMAYGTESIPRVYKIFGPGNQYVTMAKQLVQQEGIAIDMPAGPSEVLVVADKNANASFVASDLISQAEHGPDSQVLLLTDNKSIAERVIKEVEKQTAVLPRKELVEKSISNSSIIILRSLDECMDFSNMYAPEHLVLNTAKPETEARKVVNAGSVFLGPFSCESMGDYASGTNHTLPTNSFARNYSGVSTESFMKKITFQEVSEEGIRLLGPAVELMAEAEMLLGHRNAVSLRLKKLSDD
ncbi:MAG TPA: histidinol dehydrogenase [Bacteroidales bacterium]|nr:histidinol dehydrogenase [Bacteroidales bacterium]